MKTQQLLFELSHPVRYAILNAIAEKPQRMTKIGEMVDANSPEVSRHLERLKNASLVEKQPEGAYSISPMGKMTLLLLPGLSFVAHNEEYLQNHDLSGLPMPFITRIGNLLGGERKEGVYAAIRCGIEIARETGEKLYIAANEASDEFDEVTAEKVMEGIEFRIVVDRNFLSVSPDRVAPDPEGRKAMRVIDEIPAMFMLSEKDASICFRNRKGEFDFQSSFFSGEPVFVKWCEDFFEYLWSKGKTVDEHFM